jgi:hypothetical protein
MKNAPRPRKMSRNRNCTKTIELSLKTMIKMRADRVLHNTSSLRCESHFRKFATKQSAHRDDARHAEAPR